MSRARSLSYIVAFLAVLTAALNVQPASSASRKHRAPPPQPHPAEARREPTSPDDLYRRRGYGIGGLAFGLGQGGTAQAGACADLAFAQPRNCGPRGGYGIYGNGLGYGFGF